MHIQLETSDKYTIEACDDTQVTIDSTIWRQNIVVSKHGIVTDWGILDITDLKDRFLEPLLLNKAEIILIGHSGTDRFAPPATQALLTQHRIGFESMSVGAACRTYNVLLSENREVVLGLIMTEQPCQKK